MSTATKPGILIVEDVASDIDILNHILKQHYTVLIAKTGEGALKVANESRPDLILLDIILPDMTGFIVLEKLKESRATRGIPVIIITAINNAQYEEKGLSLGAVDYITKPFHTTVVQARIATHMQMTRYVRTIEKLGLIDPLTELPNRRGFENQISTEWARGFREKWPLGLMVVNIDGFKEYIDRYGVPQGDELLCAVARLVQDSLKRPADMAARWEADEFVVMLPNTDLDGTALVAEDIRAGVEALHIPLRLDDAEGTQMPGGDPGAEKPGNADADRERARRGFGHAHGREVLGRLREPGVFRVARLYERTSLGGIAERVVQDGLPRGSGRRLRSRPKCPEERENAIRTRDARHPAGSERDLGDDPGNRDRNRGRTVHPCRNAGHHAPQAFRADAERPREGTPGRGGRCGRGDADEIGLPGQHEPRNPHAHERRHRIRRVGAG